MDPADFNYHLPAERIAQKPLAERSASRLLELSPSGGHRDLQFKAIGDLVDSGDLLVLNDTRVLAARLFGSKPTGGRVEMLLERTLDGDAALVQLKSSRAPTVGMHLRFDGGVTAVVEERRDRFFVLRFSEPIEQLLEMHGHVPLPPYIDRPADSGDRERYQTVFARRPGAVAAPTAGLHFDTGQLNRLRAKGVDVAYLTLHVGAGTFQPPGQAQLEARRLHAERVEVAEPLCAAVRATRARGGRVIAVGTTVVRGLETAAAHGNGEVVPFHGETDLFIFPGYRFRTAEALLTNFHLPGSSLLMLVCAFAGTARVLDAYAHAVREGYRFYSYGDAMFCYRADTAKGAPA